MNDVIAYGGSLGLASSPMACAVTRAKAVEQDARSECEPQLSSYCETRAELLSLLDLGFLFYKMDEVYR